MDKLTKILISVAISLSFIAILISINKPAREFITGSVSYGSEYQGTTTRAIPGTSLTSPTTLCSTNGVLGSLVITGANTGVINFYDGTTTSSHTDHATTTIATIPASTAAGTYTFDVSTRRGLIYDVASGNTATATITYRCN